jgi:hypothetical protein
LRWRNACCAFPAAVPRASWSSPELSRSPQRDRRRPGVAVFSAQHLFFGDYQNVTNLNLSRADAFTCSNLMPGGLYRGDPASIPVALQLHPVNVPTAAPEAHGSVDTYGCKNGNYGVAVFSRAHVFFALMPPGLYRGDPNNIPASLQLQH